MTMKGKMNDHKRLITYDHERVYDHDGKIDDHESWSMRSCKIYHLAKVNDHEWKKTILTEGKRSLMAIM